MTKAPSPRDLKRFGAVLRVLQQRVLRTLRHVERDVLGSAEAPVTHEGDLREVDMAFEEVDLDLLDNEEDAAEAISEALERIDDGTYGRCVDCDAWIARRRLETIPYAARCVPCQADFEDGTAGEE
jgi:RNA polymerase-binding transcription factor DksA